MGAISNADKHRFESSWDHHALRDQPEALIDFQSLRHRRRIFAYHGKMLVAWQLDPGDWPDVTETYTFAAADLSFKAGPSLTLLSGPGRTLQVTHQPQKLFDQDAFIWLPAFNEIRWTPSDWRNPASPRVLRMAVELKTRTTLEDHGPLAGRVYISELHTFQRMWPLHPSLV